MLMFKFDVHKKSSLTRWTTLYTFRTTHPLSVESRLVIVDVLDHDFEEARGLLRRRSQVGGGEDQGVLVPLLSVQPNLKTKIT